MTRTDQWSDSQDTLALRPANVGPPSQTVCQHSTGAVQTCAVFWTFDFHEVRVRGGEANSPATDSSISQDQQPQHPVTPLLCHPDPYPPVLASSFPAFIPVSLSLSILISLWVVFHFRCFVSWFIHVNVMLTYKIISEWFKNVRQKQKDRFGDKLTCKLFLFDSI